MGKVKVLVTGAAGQLGQTIKELYDDNNLNLEFVFVSKTDLDITKKTDLTNFFSKYKFHYCINCAAYTNVEQAEKTPEIAFKINAEGVKNLAEVCDEKEVVLIHISTDYVFDGEKTTPYTVQDKPNPINEYGKSKLLGEHYIQDILDKYFIIRTSWLYSKKYGHNFYKTIVKKAKKAERLSITDEQTGCPTDTVNLSDFIVTLIKKNNSSFGLYHFSNGVAMTWYDFAINILKENNMSNNNLVTVGKYRTFAQRPKNSVIE
jgi:dTDP-4-dehydrorhamnose reductase